MNTPKKLVRALFPNVYKDSEEFTISEMKDSEIARFKRLYNTTSDVYKEYADYLDTIFDMAKFRKHNAEITLRSFVNGFNGFDIANDPYSYMKFDYKFIATQDDGEFFVISLPYNQMRKWQITAKKFMAKGDNRNVFVAIIWRDIIIHQYIFKEISDALFKLYWEESDIVKFMNVSKKEYNKKFREITKNLIKK